MDLVPSSSFISLLHFRKIHLDRLAKAQLGEDEIYFPDLTKPL